MGPATQSAACRERNLRHASRQDPQCHSLLEQAAAINGGIASRTVALAGSSLGGRYNRLLSTPLRRISWNRPAKKSHCAMTKTATMALRMISTGRTFCKTPPMELVPGNYKATVTYACDPTWNEVGRLHHSNFRLSDPGNGMAVAESMVILRVGSKHSGPAC